MTKLISVIITCLISFHLNAQDLQQHRWKNRVLIVKTQEAHSSKYQQQLAEWNEADEALKERRLVLYQVRGSEYQLTNYQHTDQRTSGMVADVFAKEMFDEEHPFEVILIGLDGGLKLQQTKLLTKKELFRLIDSMPMRQSELRNKNRKKG